MMRPVLKPLGICKEYAGCLCTKFDYNLCLCSTLKALTLRVSASGSATTSIQRKTPSTTLS